MSLNVEIDSRDYQSAVRGVQELLNNIRAVGEGAELEGLPDASDIVDVVWYHIR